MSGKNVCAWIDGNEKVLWQISEDIWAHPELSQEEYHAAGCLAEILENNGFVVERKVAGLETAFKASWGHGGKRIGLLAEYDALSGLSQQVLNRKMPVAGQKAGHGCGHNLLGTAVIGAAVSVKEYLEKSGKEGTIEVFGCPSEEIMLGKIIMAKARVFDGLDVALSWHPGGCNQASEASYQAMRSVSYTFSGTASHASMAPEKGRSALDAVELMDIGANYLREHLPPGGQVQYVITDGGSKPNIVPDKSGVWYFIRAVSDSDVQAIAGRLDNIAKGAALMTDTSYVSEILTGCHETLIVPALVNILHEGMEENLHTLVWSAADRQFAHEIMQDMDVDAEGRTLHDGLKTPTGKAYPIKGSSDLSDVSWQVPTGMFFVCCYPRATPNHSWQVTACAGSDIGRKGMLFAARSLACTARNLLEKPGLIEKIKIEFDELVENKRK